MKKRLHATALLCLFIIIQSAAQPIHYSNNKLDNTAYKYQVIGEVNNNIIVWCNSLLKQRAAQILVYDKSMNLLNTVNTDIKQIERGAGAHFFITGNTFQVLYLSTAKDGFLLKLAAFNDSGSKLYERTIDSVETSNNANTENLYYQVLQPKHRKAVCFVKMHSNRRQHMLTFQFSFIQANNLTHKTFTVPFNEDLEDITDMLVDENRNIVLLKQRKTNSGVDLTLLKLGCKSNAVEGTSKTVNAYFVKPNSMRIVESNSGYTVFGLLRKEYTNRNREEGLYVWQTSADLFDMPGDTILHQPASNNLATYAACIAGNATASNVFAVWNATENTNASQKRQGVYTLQDDLAAQAFEKNHTLTNPYKNLSLVYYDEKALMNQTSATKNIVKEADLYQPDKLQLININSGNKITWKAAITDNLDGITIANLDNVNIISTAKRVHIVCEVFVKDHPGTLNHIIVEPDGTVSEKLLTNWGRRYTYNLSESVYTGTGELVIPAYKNKRMWLAAIKLE